MHREMYIKTAVILVGVAICNYCSFFLTSSFAVSAGPATCSLPSHSSALEPSFVEL